jgi:heterodisulfide reductase subunit B
MTQISEPQAFELIRRLLQSAQEYRADVIICICPMCQLNLDAYQSRVNSFFDTNFQLPVLFLTQLLGIALGLDWKALGVGKEIVSAEPVLQAKLEATAAAGS